MTDKQIIKKLEARVNACDDLFISFCDCIHAVGSTDKQFKKSINVLQKRIEKYNSLLKR